MSVILQPDSVRELDRIILGAYSDARVQPAELEVIEAKQHGDDPLLRVARHEENNLLRLFVGIEKTSGKSIAQIHMIGLYATGSALLLDSRGGPEDFSPLYEPDLREIIDITRSRRETGDFKPKRTIRSLFSFLSSSD